MKEIKKLLTENNIISKDGIKVNGNGIIVKKLDKLIELTDKTNLKLYYIEKRLDEIKDEIKDKIKPKV